MKNRNTFRILICVLSLVMIAGSLSILLPARVDESIVCDHPRACVVSSSVIEGEEANILTRRVEYRCDKCGEIIVQNNALDDFNNNLPTEKNGKPVYNGNWSVGYMMKDTGIFHEYDAILTEGGTVGTWLCLSSESSSTIWGSNKHGGFRFRANGAPGFGLSAGTSCYIAVCYTAPRTGVIAMDVSTLKSDTSGCTPNFNIRVNGETLIANGLELNSDAYNTVEELNSCVSGIRLSVSAGDKIYFTLEADADKSINMATFFSPRVEYVDTPFTVMTCRSGCDIEASGVCEICRAIFWNTTNGLQSLYVIASDGTSRYCTFNYYDGMTWADATRLFQDYSGTGYTLFVTKDEMYNSVQFVYEDALYSVLLNGKAVKATDKIVKGGCYIVELPAV